MKTASAFPPGTKEFWDFMASQPIARGAGDVDRRIFEGDIFPLQRINELAIMMQTARSRSPQVVMEIGSDKGGGFFHWVNALPSVRRAIAVEFNGIPFADQFRKMFPDVEFCFVEGSSYETANVAKVKDFLEHPSFAGPVSEGSGCQIDCLFIDGDKNGTARDFYAYSPFVRRGGLVFIHDIEDRTIHPSQFFYSLARYFQIMAIFDGREGEDAAKREAAGEPVANSYEQWLRAWKWKSCGVGVVQL